MISKFSTNVIPRKFGRGKDILKDWKCIFCDNQNKSYYKDCQLCTVPKNYIVQVKENESK